MQQHLGINEVVKHSDKPDDVASSDPELRVWDALDAGTHDGTLQDAILEHMQVCCHHVTPTNLGLVLWQPYCCG